MERINYNRAHENRTSCPAVSDVPRHSILIELKDVRTRAAIRMRFRAKDQKKVLDSAFGSECK
jgi:hypothetical protein